MSKHKPLLTDDRYLSLALLKTYKHESVNEEEYEIEKSRVLSANFENCDYY